MAEKNINFKAAQDIFQDFNRKKDNYGWGYYHRKGWFPTVFGRRYHKKKFKSFLQFLLYKFDFLKFIKQKSSFWSEGRQFKHKFQTGATPSEQCVWF